VWKSLSYLIWLLKDKNDYGIRNGSMQRGVGDEGWGWWEVESAVRSHGEHPGRE